MADFNLPSLSDLFGNIITYLKNRDTDLALGLDPANTTPANLPNHSIRWNSAGGKWEKLNNGTWSDLTNIYYINANLLQGYGPSNASGSLAINNGTLNTNLNADMVDGHHAGTSANQVLLLDGGGKVPAGNIPATGITQGTYKSVTVGTDGRVTGGSNPTTLAGYGITDAASLAGNSGQNFSLKDGTFYGSLVSQYNNTALAAGDIAAARSDGTGVIWLGTGGNHYLQWSGSYYELPTSDLRIKGNVAWHAGNFTPSSKLDTGAQAADSAMLGGEGPSYYAKASDVAAAVPTGTVSMFAGASAPNGYLMANGQAVSRTTYSALYGVIGTTFGAGDGSTTFNLPNMCSRVPVGAGQGSGLTNRALGATGGEETHLLTTGEMPSHNHSASDSGHNHGINQYGWGGSINPGSSGMNSLSGTYGQGQAWTNTGWANISIGSTGGGAAHNNMQPFVALNFIIKT